jgi:Cu+-exporting ATPase
MTCASCKNLIESEASKIQGIQSINVNFASENASLVIDSSYSEVRFENLLISLGYRISRSDNKESTRINRDLLVAIILLLLGSIFMGLMFFMKYLSQYHMIINLVELILSTIVFATFGKKYFLNLLSFVKTFRSNMNTLIGIGVITSLGYSLILFYKNPHQHLYVESIPFILGFAFLGHYFEKLAKTKATSSLSSLYQMQLKFAVKIDIEPLTLKKSESRVPVVEIKINDIIKILPGEKLPLGGTVVEGESHINESAVNGESLPRGISKDDRLIAGSLNLEGTIFIKVEDTFSNSFVSNIIDYI